MGSQTALMVTTHHKHFLLLFSRVVPTITVMLAAMVLPIVGEVLRLADTGIFFGQQVVELNVERGHGRQLLEHLCQESLQMLLCLLLLNWLLLHLRC